MTGITQKFVSLNISTAHSSIKIADGTHSHILGNGVVQATPSLTLTNVLYIPRFTVNLLSISQLTKQNKCKIIFFSSHCVFRTCRLGRELVWGISEETCTIWTIE